MIICFLLIQWRETQVFLAKKGASFLSEKLHTKVEIGSIDIEFFKKLVLEDVYIEDLHKDTLLYAKKLKLDIDKIDFEKHILTVSSIQLNNSKVALIKYKDDEDLNLQFILNLFKSSDTTNTDSSVAWNIQFKNVVLNDVDFKYQNQSSETVTKGMNYDNIHVQNINSTINDVKFVNDTIFALIENLSAQEHSGFNVQKLNSKFRISPVDMTFENMLLETSESKLITNLKFEYATYADFNDFIDKVTIKADFNKSIVEMDDIAYFAPEIKGMYQKILLSGQVNGKINNIRGKKMNIKLLNTTTQFKGDIKLTGLPNIEETLIYLNVEQLASNYYDLKQLAIPPFDKSQTLNVPDNIKKLGKMTFKGTFTGLYNDFYAYGNFSSALGDLYTDLSVQNNYEKKQELYKGKLKSSGFNFGAFFDVPLLGSASVDISIDGSGLKIEDLVANLNGTINSLEFNNYTYKNIIVEGDIAKQIFKGKLNVQDENIDFDFNGNVDFTGSLPKLDFIASLNKADVGALNFFKTTKKSILSTQVIINVVGNNIDNLIGTINLDNTILKQDKETFKISTFNLVSSENNGKKSINIYSDFLDATVKGDFKILELPKSIENLLSLYLPSYFDKPTASNNLFQEFEYNLVFKKTEAITRLFIPKLSIAPKTTFKGSFNSNNNQLTINGNSSKIAYGDFSLHTCNISAVTGKDLMFDIASNRLYISKENWLSDFNVISSTMADSVDLEVAWNNRAYEKNSGDLKSTIHFAYGKKIEIHTHPSQFFIADSLWSITKENKIIIDSTHIEVQNLLVEHENQSVLINGSISESKTDALKLKLVNFNLGNLNKLTEKSGVYFKGSVNGESTVTDIYNNLLLTSNNNFNALSINDNALGDGNISTVWDNTKEALSVNGLFSSGIVPNIVFSGYYYPKKTNNNIDLKLNTEAMKLQIFEPFLKDYCSNFKGFFSGNVEVKGSIEKPILSGIIHVNAKKVTLDYLNTTYNFSDDIVIDSNSFSTKELVLYDINHNKATVTGGVYHNNFKNFQLDISIVTDKFMCLNTTESSNNPYYGKAYVSGPVNFSGYTDNILIEADVRTESIASNSKGDKINLQSKELTTFFIPLSGNDEVSENNFITFVKKDSTIKIKDDYKIKIGGLTLDFDLHVTTDAEVQLIFDKTVGDVIRSRGNGNIKLEINSKGDFKMFGDYVVDQGDYLFTLENIINKRFYLEKGGTIKWSGIPYKADINLNATYKARASLKPFFSDVDSTNSLYKVRYPIDLKLAMTNDLLSPEINFDIGIPTVDASIRQQVMSYINNEAEMNRQVFSLLVLNSFVTPYQLTNTGSGTTVGSAAGANTSELISNQLSNMLSKISNDFDVGVNYRPGDEISKDELEVALSTQLFNDKLSIDGNVGRNTTNTQNANSIVGDVNVEYKLTDDGKFRVKAFNRANDNNLSFSTGPYTQGVGVFYREEFNSVGELFTKYWNGVFRRKKKETTKEIPNTTIIIEPEKQPLAK